MTDSDSIEHDAWKQMVDLLDRFTQTWEVRSDLEVTALGCQRKVRLRVGDYSHNFVEQDRRKHKPEPQITSRNVSTMRELAEALLAACDFVDAANPKWAEQAAELAGPWKTDEVADK